MLREYYTYRDTLRIVTSTSHASALYVMQQ
jgi:hypothetical protein